MELTLDQALQKGIEAHKAGNLKEAERYYTAIVKANPKHPDANHNMGVLAVGAGKVQEALPLFQIALEVKPNIAQFWLSYIDALIKLDRTDEANAVFVKAKSRGAKGIGFDKLKQQLDGVEKDKILISATRKSQVLTEEQPHSSSLESAILLRESGEFNQAIDLLKTVINQSPEDVDALAVLSHCYLLKNQVDLAKLYLDKAKLIAPDNALVRWNIVRLKLKQQKSVEALNIARDTSQKFPEDVEGMGVLGACLRVNNEVDESLEVLNRAIELNPNYAEALIQRGLIKQSQKNKAGALADIEQAYRLKPHIRQIWDLVVGLKVAAHEYSQAIVLLNNMIEINPKDEKRLATLALCYQKLKNFEASETAYKKALAIKPDYAEAYVNFGSALKEQGKLVEAIAAYKKALTINPDFAEPYNNIGNILTNRGKLDEAIEAYENALVIRPNYSKVRAQKLFQQAQICDWSSIDAERSLLPELGVSGEAVVPFAILSLEDLPKRHLIRSKLYSNQHFINVGKKSVLHSSKNINRLKIGYFSADFHNHATMYLLSQVFEQHDKDNFEVYAYSYGPHKQDEMRERLIENVNVFHDVREMSDKEIVRLARSERLDIAIDLKGFTKDARLLPFAYGLAPIQVSYLGYPGTLGTDIIDYIVADPVVIPLDKQGYYSEQIIYLPHTYQPTDNKRSILDVAVTRTDLGLPKEGFIFCCFNKNYKISPREFNIWMRLLQKVEGSVLWLLKSNKWAEQNLKREAEARGVNPQRLIFAELVPPAEHLARQKLADLFLDTFNYNAHTTTSDALWVGLPVLTKLGESFAARVAGSLLNAIGLPEMVTDTEEQYEALALSLSTNPELLSKIKAKLAENRLTQPLFDSEQYTMHLEMGYKMAYERSLIGKKPKHIYV